MTDEAMNIAKSEKNFKVSRSEGPALRGIYDLVIFDLRSVIFDL